MPENLLRQELLHAQCFLERVCLPAWRRRHPTKGRLRRLRPLPQRYSAGGHAVPPAAASRTAKAMFAEIAATAR